MNTRVINKSRLWVAGAVAGLMLLMAGCALTPKYYQESGPSVDKDWASPTAADVKTRFEPSAATQRDWPALQVATRSGTVQHYPLYFEDPFEDKGHGRTDATHPRNVYRLGWEDWVAMPYGLSRFTLNWLMLPVSAVVTPPWTVMASDGVLSRQALGYDHDATRADQAAAPPPQDAEATPAVPHDAEAEDAEEPLALSG